MVWMSWFLDLKGRECSEKSMELALRDVTNGVMGVDGCFGIQCSKVYTI